MADSNSFCHCFISCVSPICALFPLEHLSNEHKMVFFSVEPNARHISRSFAGIDCLSNISYLILWHFVGFLETMAAEFDE